MILLDRAARLLEQGEVIAYPTETVYGLGADPWREEAVQAVSRLKGREESKGYILLIDGPAQLETLVIAPLSTACRLMEAFWPGPLTLVLTARPELPPWLSGGKDEIAVRWSPHPLVASLLARWGRPLLSTSANPSGSPPLTSSLAVSKLWGTRLALILDDPTPVDSPDPTPSTILRVRKEGVTLVRPGALSLDRIRAELPDRALINEPDGSR